MIGLVPLVMPKTPGILNPVSAEYYQRKLRAQNLSAVPVGGEDLERLWRKAEDVFGWLEGLYRESGGGPFFMGEVPSYADFALGGVLEELRILGDGDRMGVDGRGFY
jgi:glutathione S-transferase